SIRVCFICSSRRRHTRFSRDWSSDVCSSDLGGDLAGVEVEVDPAQGGDGAVTDVEAPGGEQRLAGRGARGWLPLSRRWQLSCRWEVGCRWQLSCRWEVGCRWEGGGGRRGGEGRGGAGEVAAEAGGTAEGGA